MVNLTEHAKTKWLIRGDVSKQLSDAWENGDVVDMPHKSCDESRIDTGSKTIMLRRGDDITTVLNAYSGMSYYFRTEVECYDCGQHHHRAGPCPICGSHKWRCR